MRIGFYPYCPLLSSTNGNSYMHHKNTLNMYNWLTYTALIIIQRKLLTYLHVYYFHEGDKESDIFKLRLVWLSLNKA